MAASFRWTRWHDWSSFHLLPQYLEMLVILFVKVRDDFVHIYIYIYIYTSDYNICYKLIVTKRRYIYVYLEREREIERDRERQREREREKEGETIFVIWRYWQESVNYQEPLVLCQRCPNLNIYVISMILSRLYL